MKRSNTQEVFPVLDDRITKELVEKAKHRIFRKEAWATAGDYHVLGVMLSQYFNGDGYYILRACSAALEDANFHSENTELQRMFPQAFRD